LMKRSTNGIEKDVILNLPINPSLVKVLQKPKIFL